MNTCPTSIAPVPFLSGAGRLRTPVGGLALLVAMMVSTGPVVADDPAGGRLDGSDLLAQQAGETPDRGARERAPERAERGDRSEGRGPGAPGATDQGERSERDRRRWRGRSIEGITPEQQQQLRRAMAEAWNDARVVSAREEIERSMEAYRDALREAVLEAAPELADVLPDNFDGRSWLGDQRGGALGALRSIMAALPSEVQSQARRKHGELMRDEAVAAAANALNEAYRNSSAPGDASVALHEREFRRAYVAALAREVPEAVEYLERLREGRPGGGGRGPGDGSEEGREGEVPEGDR